MRYARFFSPETAQNIVTLALLKHVYLFVTSQGLFLYHLRPKRLQHLDCIGP